MQLLDLILGTLLVGLSLILMLVSYLSFRRHRNNILGLVLISYIIYALLGTFVLLSNIMEIPGLQISSVFVVMNIGVLLMQYLALIRS